jgi:hypothetical protein
VVFGLPKFKKFKALPSFDQIVCFETIFVVCLNKVTAEYIYVEKIARNYWQNWLFYLECTRAGIPSYLFSFKCLYFIPYKSIILWMLGENIDLKAPGI